MILDVQDLSFRYSKNAKPIFHNVNLQMEKGEILTILGANGAGKSTLLNCLANILEPYSGKILVNGASIHDMSLKKAAQLIGYVPQNHAPVYDYSVRDFIVMGRAPHLGMLEKPSENDYAIVDEVIRELGIEKLADKAYTQISGGERQQALIGRAIAQQPEIIMFDEPTNHLDSSGRQRLYDWVEKCHSTLLVVSHDRTLLNLLPEICELEKHQLTYYGGNYEFYKEQKTLMQEALQQRIEEKEKALRIARKVARETAERRDKQNVRGEKANIKRGVPRIVLNALQGKSEKSTGKLNSVHQEKADKLTEERNQLRGSLSPTAALKTDFNGSSLHTGKTLITAKDINFGYHSAPNDSDSQSDNEPSENNLPEQLLWQTPVSFQLKSGDRLRIEGTNGSGKTTLLKIITGQLQPQEGNLTRMEFTYVYLNQEYSIIDDRNSVLEQVYAFNNRNLPEHEIKIILNRYLFPASEWDKSCRKLSGGEKMRLAFCCLMISNNTPDMFILDEPTNNLDIQSIDIITATIRNYTGTVIAISHDNYFIREIGIEQRIVLS